MLDLGFPPLLSTLRENPSDYINISYVLSLPD